jgi:hypothetical protein
MIFYALAVCRASERDSDFQEIVPFQSITWSYEHTQHDKEMSYSKQTGAALNSTPRAVAAQHLHKREAKPAMLAVAPRRPINQPIFRASLGQAAKTT